MRYGQITGTSHVNSGQMIGKTGRSWSIARGPRPTDTGRSNVQRVTVVRQLVAAHTKHTAKIAGATVKLAAAERQFGIPTGKLSSRSGRV